MSGILAGAIGYVLTISGCGFSSVHSLPLYDRVDLIEYNHIHDFREDGTEFIRFRQLVFWERLPDYPRMSAIAWVIAEDNFSLPYKMQNGMWRWQQFDTAVRKMRIVDSKLFRETHTRYDPEADDRNFRDSKFRPRLSSPIIMKITNE